MFTFNNVFNPVQVQYEIFDRMYAYKRRQEEKSAARERERVADWLIAYHRQAQRLEKIKSRLGDDEFSG